MIETSVQFQLSVGTMFNKLLLEIDRRAIERRRRSSVRYAHFLLFFFSKSGSNEVPFRRDVDVERIALVW